MILALTRASRDDYSADERTRCEVGQLERIQHEQLALLRVGVAIVDLSPDAEVADVADVVRDAENLCTNRHDDYWRLALARGDGIAIDDFHGGGGGGVSQ